MARRSFDEFTKPTDTVIGKGYTIEAARFSCSDGESMRIDGTLIGDVDIEGVLIISDTGYVNGDISASSVRVAGRVSGNIHCRNTLHFSGTADVAGDVRATTLTVDDGAIFIGRCQTSLSIEGKVKALEVT